MLDQPMRGLRVPEALEALKISVRTLRRWIRQDKIRSKMVGNTLFINRDDVAAIVAADSFDESED